MSRSYKKHSYGGDDKNKFMKKYSNHKIRQKLKNPNYILKGRDFRKVLCSWNICDYWTYQSWNHWWKNKVKLWQIFSSEKGEPFPDKEKEYNRWAKWNKRK